MPPRNEDYISIGRTTPQLGNVPMPSQVINDLGMQGAQSGKDVLSTYQKLVKSVDDLQPQIDRIEKIKSDYIKIMEANEKDFSKIDDKELEKIASEIEKDRQNQSEPVKLSRDAKKIGKEISELYEQEQKYLEDMRKHLINKREEVRNLLKENPELKDPLLKHQDYAIGRSVQNKVEQMNPQDILNQLKSSGQMGSKDISNLMNLKPDQRESQLKQMMMNQELSKRREEQKKEQEAVRIAADAQNRRAGMHDKDLQKEVDKLIKQGRITPNEANPYLKGEQSKEDFLNRFGPDITAGHVNAQVVSGPPGGGVGGGTGGGGVGGQGGITGPGGPIPPNSPIDVRVINPETDPIPVSGAGGGGGKGKKGDEDEEEEDGKEDKAETFMRRQELANILSGVTDMATPGGGAIGHGIVTGIGALGTNPALRGSVKGLAGRAIGGVGSALGMGGEAAAGLGAAAGGLATGGLALAGVGGKTWYEGAQYQRENERQFGTEQGEGMGSILGSPMFNAQAGARLSNWMLAGEEIDKLTETMSSLGSTAEETAEALGPAADALNRYRILTPELSATAAREGQMYGSTIGANEAGVLGRNMQDVAGQGFSADHLRELATAGNQAFQTLGLPGGANAAMAVASAESSSRDPRNDMTLQSSGFSQKSIQAGVEAQTNPLEAGQILGMAAGVDVTKIDASSVTGRTQLSMLLPQAIANNVNIDSYERDENGKIRKDGDNLYRAAMDAQTVSGLTGTQITAPELLAQLDTMNEENQRRGTTGAQGLMEKAQVSDTRSENIRKRMEAGTTGETQGDQYSKGGAGIDPSTIKYDPETGEEIEGSGQEYGFFSQLSRGAGVLGAEVTGLDWLAPSSSSLMQSGERGSIGGMIGNNQLYDEGQGTVLGTLGSAGVDPGDVETDQGGTLEEALQDPSRKEAILAGEEKLKVGDKSLTADELSKGLADESISFDKGFLGIGSGLQFAAGDEGQSKIDLTDRAAEYFEIVGGGNATDPYGLTGNVTNAQDTDAANRGDKPLSDVGRPVSGG